MNAQVQRLGTATAPAARADAGAADEHAGAGDGWWLGVSGLWGIQVKHVQHSTCPKDPRKSTETGPAHGEAHIQAQIQFQAGIAAT